MLFALVGAIPLLGGVLVQSEPLRQWAATETARLLEEQLGLTASYSVELNLLPLRLAVTDLVVPAKDGSGPALTASSVSVRPRFFSLLAGRVDVGDIELEETRVRLVVKDGVVQNVDYRLPESNEESPELERAPFKSLSVSDVRFDLDVDGTRLKTGAIDIDVFAEKGLVFDVALRMGEGSVRAVRTLPPPEDEDEPKAEPGKAAEPPRPHLSYDEDTICGLELRVRATPKDLLIRRLSLLAVADLESTGNTAPKCAESNEDDPGRVAVRLSQVHVDPATAIPHITGHVLVRAPGALVNRYVPGAPIIHGYAGYSGDVEIGGATRLPTLHGRISGANLGVEFAHFAQKLDGEVKIEDDVVEVPTLQLRAFDGDVQLSGIRIAPFDKGGTLGVERIEVKGALFPSLMRDLEVTNHSWVGWDYDDVVVTKVHGTLSPFFIDGGVRADTSDFAVWNSAWDDPAKEQMVGVKRSHIETRFRASPRALEFYDATVAFGKSKVGAKLVSIGLADGSFALDVPEGAVIELSDIGPLGGLPIAGEAHLSAKASGILPDVVITSELSVDRFMLADFDLGDIKHASGRFQPLKVDFTNVLLDKNGSEFDVDRARLEFDGQATVAFDAHVASKRFSVRDFFAIWHFDTDPRYESISGTGRADATVHFALGGPEDVCKSGVVKIDGRVALDKLTAFEERYTGAEADFRLHWLDMEADSNGFEVEVPSFAVRKGSGAFVGSLHITPGAAIEGNVVGSAIPVSNIDGLDLIARQWDGVLDGVGRVSGTLDALAITANVDLSEIRVGRARLPRSSFRVRLDPEERPRKSRGKSRCGNAIPTEFDLAEYQRDRSDGTFHVAGQLFGGQVTFDDLTMTRQKSKLVAGKVTLRDLDLGSLLESWPQLAERYRARGKLSGVLSLDEYFIDRPLESQGALLVTGATLGAEGYSLALVPKEARIALARGDVQTQGFAFEVTAPGGQHGIVDLGGTVSGGRTIDASLVLRDTDLAALASLLPGVERAEGKLKARFDVQGPVRDPRYQGLLEVHGGKLFLEQLDTPVDALELEVALDSSALTVRRGTARLGGGTLELSGSAPLVGRDLGRLTGRFIARGVSLPLGEGIRLALDADLEGIYAPSATAERSLPKVTGTVAVLSAEYTRPMAVTADLAALTGRGKKTEVDAYDPTRDNVELDVLVISKGPLRVRNDLVDAELRIDPAGLRISGTDQRFGAVGSVQLNQGGQLRLRRNEFEIRQGIVRFNDPTRIAPQVDVTATTEYRRYDAPTGTEGPAATTTTAPGSATMGGLWRINLHAYGEPENLRVDLTSDPSLAQDDIFLLLTVGLTRAELDQTRSAGVGSSVALEALGTLSGAGEAVTEAVPVIDDFRFGSAYSSRTGRTEPTVTIGKRLSERIRASVTTSLAGSSEVRSNVEWRVSQRVSVEGSYDNVEDIGSPVVGNLGGDVRWRLEFE